jgi:hypothetical protein
MEQHKREWNPSDEPLRALFFNPDAEDMNRFLRDALRSMTSDPVLDTREQRPVATVCTHFLDSVIKSPLAAFKLFAILMLIRSDSDICDMFCQRERPEVMARFLPRFETEYDLFTTGLRPPTDDEVRSRKQSAKEYVKDDPEGMEHHCVQFFVFRMMCLYCSL